MANVLFKQGTQNNLDTIRRAKSASDGTFYLTNDSHRLYIGIVSGDAVPVNEGVTTVATIDDLPKGSTHLEAGHFYYVSGSNVLCVFNGTNWVQINSNTNTYIDRIDIIVSVAADSATITTKAIEHGTGTEYKDDFKISGQDGIGVALNGTGDGVVLTGDTYELGGSYDDTSRTTTISLTSQNTDNDTEVKIKAGDNISMNMADGAINLASKDTILDRATSGYGSSPVDTATDKQGFYVQVTDTDGNAATAQINPIIQVGGTQTYYQTVHSVNGTTNLPVYTVEEIDKKFVGLDAMTYKGTLGSSGSVGILPTSGVHCGDVYLITNDGERFLVSTGVYAREKDMIIARGTEVNGVITSATLTWDIVPSGDDSSVDTTYVVVPSTNGFYIRSATGDNIGGMTVNGDGTYISIAENKNPTDGTNTLTVKHNTITPVATEATVSGGTQVDQSPVSSLVLPIISKIKRDAAGHIIEVQTRNYKITDTNSAVSEVALTASASNNLATVTTKVTTKDSAGGTTLKSGAMGIKSSTMSVTASGATVTLDMIWGTF